MGKLVYTKNGIHTYAPDNSEVIFTSLKVKPHISICGIEYKHCVKCNTWKLLRKFYTSRSKYDGLQSYCIRCSEDLSLAQTAKKRMKHFK